MGFATLDNGETQCEVIFFPDIYSKFQHLLIDDTILVVEGMSSMDDFTQGNKIVCQRAFTMTQARQHFAKSLLIKIHDQSFMKENAALLKKILKPYTGGKFPLQLEYYKEDMKVKINLDARWHVQPNDALLLELETLLGKEAVIVCYE